MTTIDEFRLTSLDFIYGRETSYRRDDSSVCISFVVNPNEDLLIQSELEFEIKFPVDYHLRGGLVVKARDVLSVVDCGLVDKIDERTREMKIPWLANTKYPLTVCFFAVRHLLKKPQSLTWKTPFEIRNSLPRVSQVHSSRNVQYVSLLAGAGRTRGRRSYMEDVDFVFDSIMTKDRKVVSVIGVLDGHGGKECAQFAGDEIPMKIAALLRNGKACDEALYTSFITTDEEFMGCGKSTAGSTACVLLWHTGTGMAYVANAGDTRAVLCRSGRAVDLTRDKKATTPEEIERIARAGGFVANGRVMGSLAVSRALGDAHLKGKNSSYVISAPEVTTFRPNVASADGDYGRVVSESGRSPRGRGVDGVEVGGDGGGSRAVDTDEFIIIATDGLWDVMSSQEAADMAREQMQRVGLVSERVGEKQSPDTVKAELARVADYMANHAVKVLGSQDNVTIMLIKITIGNPDAVVDVADAPVDVDGDGDAPMSARSSDGSRRSQPSNPSSTKSATDSSVPSSSHIIGSTGSCTGSSAKGRRRDDAGVGALVEEKVTTLRFGPSSGSGPEPEPFSLHGGQGNLHSPRYVDEGRGDAKAAIPQWSSKEDFGGTKPRGGGDEDDLLDFLLDDSNFSNTKFLSGK